MWLFNPQLLDTENKNVADKSRSLLYCVVLKNMIYKNNQWTNGTIYDPQKGNTYKCKVWIENNTLKIRGYVGLFYETETWTKQ